MRLDSHILSLPKPVRGYADCSAWLRPQRG